MPLAQQLRAERGQRLHGAGLRDGSPRGIRLIVLRSNGKVRLPGSAPGGYVGSDAAHCTRPVLHTWLCDTTDRVPVAEPVAGNVPVRL